MVQTGVGQTQTQLRYHLLGKMYYYPDTFLLDVDKERIAEFLENPIIRCQRYGHEEWRKRNYN